MRILTLLLAAAVAMPAGAAVKLYKWTDEAGITHYSDEPPTGQKYEAREIKVDPVAKAPAEAPPGASQDEAAGVEADADGVEPGEAAEENQNCQRVRANLATLERSEVVQMDLDGDGETETLTEEQRTQQIDLAERQIAAYCG